MYMAAGSLAAQAQAMINQQLAMHAAAAAGPDQDPDMPPPTIRLSLKLTDVGAHLIWFPDLLIVAVLNMLLSLVALHVWPLLHWRKHTAAVIVP